MAKLYHCLVKKPFDRYDNAGGVAVLSENGHSRMTTSKKHADHVELLAVEDSDGSVFDAKGVKVLSPAQRKGPIDPFAIAEACKKGDAVDGAADREEKKSKTR